jgi:hypothetical protein
LARRVLNIDTLKIFFTTWGTILFLNQLIIFGCFAPHCILAGLPHTGIIAFLLTYYIFKDTSLKAKDGLNNKEIKPKPKRKRTRQIHNDNEVKSNPNTPDNLEIPNPESIMKTAQEKLRLKKKLKYDEALNDENRNKKLEDEINPLKTKGDEYERFIGKKFEEIGELVIYNGFIRGYEDDGVDLITINSHKKTVHLIQCKNWSKKPMLYEDIRNIYRKLEQFDIDRVTTSAKAVKEFQQKEMSLDEIQRILRIHKKTFTLRMTLYVSSEKVIDLKIGEHVKMIKPNIFKYQDMKIVLKPMLV